MIAAIYARKSTDQKDVAKEAQSVTRQKELALAFAEAKGWTVAPGHVYDEGDDVSGASFGDDGRPVLASLLVAAERREFGAVVLMDETRLGRDQFRTGIILADLHDAGVEVWFYQDGRRAQLDDATGRFMESAKLYAGALEREKGSARARETALRIAKGGNVAGNKLYGFRNERAGAFVQRVKVPEQADVVRRVFTLYADGMGDRAIRDLLNKEGVPAPRHPSKWSETTIRDLLANPTYRGELVWNRTKAVMRKGKKQTVPRPEAEWIRVDAPELRLVDDELWARARAHRVRRQMIYKRGPKGRITGRTSGEDRRGLVLSGFLSCGLCGSKVWAESKLRGPKKAPRLVRWWGCGSNIARGESACANDTRVGDAWMEHKVMEAVKAALNPAELTETFRAALVEQRAHAEDRQVRRARLERELTATEKKVRNLLDAIALGGDLPVLVADLKGEQARAEDLKAEMEKGGGSWSEDETIIAGLNRARAALAFLEFRDRSGNDAAGKVAAARATLRTYLAGPLKCFPESDGGRFGFKFSGMLAVGRLLEGSTSLASTTGATGWDCPTRPA